MPALSPDEARARPRRCLRPSPGRIEPRTSHRRVAARTPRSIPICRRIIRWSRARQPAARGLRPRPPIASPRRRQRPSSGKPPVIADPGEKPNFIAAARRAAQAAAAAAPGADVASKGAGTPKGRQRTRPLIIAGAAALILLGCIQIASRIFESGSAIAPPPPPQAQPEKSPPPVSTLPAPAPEPETAPPPQLPGPTTPPAAVPAPQPNPKTGANITTKPVRQMAAQQPDVSANDITGSLPQPAASAPRARWATNCRPPSAARHCAPRRCPAIGAAAYEVAMRFTEGHGVPRQ